MKKTWMIIIIIAALMALAGAGLIVYQKVNPANLDKKLAIDDKNTLVKNSFEKQSSRKSKPPKKIIRKITLKNQTSLKSSADLLEEFSAMDEVGRIRFIATLYSFEPALITLALNDKSKDVRITVVRFLSFIPETQVDISPFLASALNDESGEVRAEARNALDSISDENTMLKIMEKALKSKYADTRLKCVSELNKLSVPKEDFKRLLLKVLDDDDKDVRNTAIQTAASRWGKDFISGQDAIEYISGH
jgi:hypothetical protein